MHTTVILHKIATAQNLDELLEFIDILKAVHRRTCTPFELPVLPTFGTDPSVSNALSWDTERVLIEDARNPGKYVLVNLVS